MYTFYYSRNVAFHCRCPSSQLRTTGSRRSRNPYLPQLSAITSRLSPPWTAVSSSRSRLCHVSISHRAAKMLLRQYWGATTINSKFHGFSCWNRSRKIVMISSLRLLWTVTNCHNSKLEYSYFNNLIITCINSREFSCWQLLTRMTTTTNSRLPESR